MNIERSIDVEDAVRLALADHITAYCRPLPKNYGLPCILVSKVGGTERDRIDTFEVVLDARAKTESEADLTLRNAIGILKARRDDTAIRYVTVNSSGSWGSDPARPDLAMCSARLSIVAHVERATI